MAWRWSRTAVVGRRATVAACAGAGAAALAPVPRSWQAPEAPSERRLLPQLAPAVAAHCEEYPRIKCGSIRLRDGRTLAYHEEGMGTPVFCFHGMSSSRLTWLGEPLAKVCPGIRLIAVDRPGYGDSSPPPFGYSYTAFVRDLQELADSLQVNRFCVAGHSSGGPYALAAAAVLPDRVVACAAISSDAPYAHPDAPKALIEADDMSGSAKVFPSGLYGREPSDLAGDMRAGALKKGLADKVYAWKQGTDGWVCDWSLERLPWSFQVEDIALGPRLTIWYGSKDIDSIAVGAPFLQRLLPGSNLRVVEGGDHGFKRFPQHLAAILEELKEQFSAS